MNEKCELSLKFLNSLQGDYNSAGENDFIRRKQQRELRCEYFIEIKVSCQRNSLSVLQNRWKQMRKLVKQDINLRAVFEKLKDDIRKLSDELEDLKVQIREKENKHLTSSKKYLRFLRKCHIKLRRMKPKLFEENLIAHKLLGDVSEDECELRYLEITKVKDDVVGLYQTWDSCRNLVSENLLRVEEKEKTVHDLESALVGLSSFLRTESEKLLVTATHTDRGLSEVRLEKELCEQEARLDSLHTAGGRAERLRDVNSALAESRRQLDQLKSILSSSSTSCCTSGRMRRGRRRSLLSYWKLATCFLWLVLMVLMVVARPRCCDHINSSYTMLQYSGGARPI